MSDIRIATAETSYLTSDLRPPTSESHLALIEHENVDAAGGEVLQVGDRGLALRAGQRARDDGHVVEVQDRHEVHARGPGRRSDRAPAHLVFAQAGDALGDRDVGLEVVFVEGDRILRRLVHGDDAGHSVSSVSSAGRNSVAYPPLAYFGRLSSVIRPAICARPASPPPRCPRPPPWR